MISFLESTHIKIDHPVTGPVIWLAVKESKYSPGELRALGHHLMLAAEAAVREPAELL